MIIQIEILYCSVQASNLLKRVTPLLSNIRPTTILEYLEYIYDIIL